MSVTQEQIEKISKKLSKINVDDKKITGDINSILSYVDLLNQIDTTGIKPTISIINSENKLRKDIEKNTNIKNRNELLKCSNQKIIADQIAINNIMK